jgi:branched-chain amino acid transport system substrate-binding protein
MIDRKSAVGIFLGLLILSSTGASAQTREPYKIGMTWPLTGTQANSGQDYLPGAEIAVARINRAGGVNGHPLVLAVEDSQGTPPGGVSAMRKLVQVDGVQAILTLVTNVVSAQIPLADQVKVPILTSIQAPDIVSRSAFAYAHGATITSTAQLFGQYWKNHHFKRIYALIPNNALGPVNSAVYHAAAAFAGVDYAEASFNDGETDYRGVIARAKDFNPDGVIVSSPGGLDGTVIIRQLREAGMTAQIFLPGTFIDEPGWREGVGSYLEGIIMAGLDIDPVAGKGFIDDYKSKYGHVPSYLTAQLYDCVVMYAAAIAKGGYNGEAIAKQLAVMKGVPSVFGGTITMDAQHYSVPPANRLSQARNGKLVAVK